MLKIRQKDKKKNFIILLVFFIICAGIFVNSLNLSGLNYVQKTLDSEELIEEVYGYELEGNKLLYKGLDKSYIRLTGGEGLRELLFDFGELAEKDTKISIKSFDLNGKFIDKEIEKVWKKGTSFLIIELNQKSYAGFLVMIPNDFKINSVYYAFDNNVGISKSDLFLVFVIVAVVLSILLNHLVIVEKIIYTIERKIVIFLDYVNGNKRKCVFLLSIIGGGILVSMLLCYIVFRIKHYDFNYKAVYLVLIVVFLADLFLFMRKSFVNHIEIIGTVIILFVGTAFSILPPARAGVSWDDETHYIRVLQLSHVFDRNMLLADEKMLSEFASVALAHKYYSREEQKDYYQFSDIVNKRGYYVEIPRVACGYETIAYVPSAVGLILARGLSLPYHIQFIVGKWMNLLLFAILCYFSMKNLKNGNIVNCIDSNEYISGR